MMIELVEGVIWWINAFPSSNGVYHTISSEIIVIGKQNPDLNQNIIVFGSYSMVYTGTKDNMKINIVPAIALNESNEWLGYNFSGKNYTFMNSNN